MIANNVVPVSRYLSSFAPCSAVEILDTKIAPTFPATPVTTGARRPKPLYSFT